MIIVFGSLNIDIVMPVEHFPKPGETVLCATDYLSRPGGKGANQALAAARAGGKVAMVGKVGDDAFGRRSVNNLKSQGIWTAGIGISERPTGCATIAVNTKGENFIMVAPGANLDATGDQAPDDIFSDKNIVLAQLEVPHAETFDVLARAHAKGATTILNASPAGAVTQGMLASITYLIVNEIEAQQLAQSLQLDGSDPLKLARHIAGMAPHLTCIITLEAQGAVAAGAHHAYRVGCLPVEVVDTTGAGDAFCGIFAASLKAGHPWTSALHRASVGAGLACLGLGAQSGLPDADEIDAHLAQLPPPVQA
ncbi:MAG: ribokinase [Alphaproteobacteria bacterium]|nr:ribokinase [Alphaproteobacteria bacterium]